MKSREILMKIGMNFDICKWDGSFFFDCKRNFAGEFVVLIGAASAWHKHVDQTVNLFGKVVPTVTVGASWGVVGKDLSR